MTTAASPERTALHAFLDRHGSFLLTTHVNPDGDAIGSEIAMAGWLRGRGKQVRILNDSPTPPAFAWLVAEEPVETYDEALCERRFGESDALIVLDTGNRQRIGRLAQHLDRHAIAIAIVDHHATHDGFGQVNVIEPELASTASLVFELMREAGATPGLLAAEALYVGLFTDTGNFRYSNTDARAHRMAAALVEAGVDPSDVTSRVHATAPAGRLRFFGEALAALQMLEGGRLAVLEVSPEQFVRHGLAGADTEGLVDMPRAIAGVEVVALFSEVDAGKVKVSLRSTGNVTIDQVCARWGGGGHPHAAGVQMRGSREDAKAKILPDLVRLLDRHAETAARDRAS
ncbi:MAG: bifunctional oligoribonuclease/PAP phosphatase NrnA [Candidatus Eisenbacteria bacterium]|nr:bifunctional oligoribonuclease/PAP phosphatase NrnA [Candidatus Eisenbacteria bacterium]